MTDHYASVPTFASIKTFCHPDGKAENLGQHHPICLAKEGGGAMTNDTRSSGQQPREK